MNESDENTKKVKTTSFDTPYIPVPSRLFTQRSALLTMSEQQRHQAEQEQEEEGERIRIVLKLSSECTDSSLQIPFNEAIAVPCHLKRQGLSTVVNHLLGRKTTTFPKQENDDEKSDDDDDDDDDATLLPAVNFEFTIGPQQQTNHKLLRTSVEREARRNGLSLEQDIVVTYFPAQSAPSLQGQSERLPDWISAMSSSSCSMMNPNSTNNNKHNNILCTATYDGSIHVFENKTTSKTSRNNDDGDDDDGGDEASSTCVLQRIHAPILAHQGPITCLDMASSHFNNRLYLASGSMDHSLTVHCLDDVFDDHNNNNNKRKVQRYASCQGHAASIGSLDLWSSTTSFLLASGDWDGGLLIYNLLNSGDDDENEDDGVVGNRDDDMNVDDSSKKGKKQKTALSSKESKNSLSSTTPATQVLSPMISIQAHHAAKISGISWGNHEKKNSGAAAGEQLITASWDHSIKLWNIERRDCILTLNGSRVVSCVDTSPHPPALS
jgi:ribosome biogenesis protein